MKKSWMLYGLLGAVIGIGSAGLAQNPPPPPPPGPPPARDFVFLAAGPMMESKVVTGAPYSAETETEIHQTLSDGNHIDHKDVARIYRDSAGRVRRERTLSILGPMSAQGKMATLFDPVAHATYVLDAKCKIAFKMPPISRKGMIMAGGTNGEFHVRVMGAERLPGGIAAGPMPMSVSSGNFTYRREGVESEPQSVSLGTRTIDGVTADGTRTTTVIPAGKIGNEKPITIVSERWYSPKLLIYLMTRRDDPRFGTITYQLTDLKLGEPAADLFQVPAGYKVQEGRPHHVWKELRNRPAPTQP